MHAYILISKDDEELNRKAHEIALHTNSVLSPFVLQKISDVRDLGQYTKLSLASKTAFFIEHIDTVTVDAANAFLKQLEEPKSNVIFILTAASEDKVLPTIVSRCQVIRIAQNTIKSERIVLSNFFHQSIGERLNELEKIKKRDDAIEFMHELIEKLHSELISSDAKHQLVLTNRIEEAQKTLTALEKNGNVTIQLTRFVVGLLRQ